MNETSSLVVGEHLPFYITGPGETDVLFGAVAVALVLIVVGFGAVYFTIQAIPDRMVKGSSKAQMQIVGLLGLISLFTMNNIYWVAALLIAAVRIPDVVTLFRSQARSQRKMSKSLAGMAPAEATTAPVTASQDEERKPAPAGSGASGND
jgi:hypothetical protein